MAIRVKGKRKTHAISAGYARPPRQIKRKGNIFIIQVIKLAKRQILVKDVI